MLNIVHKESLPLILNGFNRLIKEDVPDPKRVQLIKKDGNKIWVLLHTSLIKLQGMKFIQVIVENITEMKIAEEKLRNVDVSFIPLISVSDILKTKPVVVQPPANQFWLCC